MKELFMGNFVLHKNILTFLKYLKSFSIICISHIHLTVVIEIINWILVLLRLSTVIIAAVLVKIPVKY